MSKNTINVYACGGAGMNIASSLKAVIKPAQPGYADINNIYIDTSLSNVNSNIEKGSMFLIEGEGIDGSGKHRQTNTGAIVPRVKEMLLKHPPAALNIVLHSNSGGSGAVIGQLLTKALLAGGNQTVVIMINSADSKKELDNAVKTLMGYDKMATTSNTPVVAICEENDMTTGRAAVDKSCHMAILTLAAMWSGENRELDSADLRNFLNYNVVTSHMSALVGLKFFSKTIELSKDETVYTATTLSDGKESTVLNVPVEYQAVGFIDKDVIDTFNIDFPIHTVTIGGMFNPMIDRMEKTLKEYDARQKAIVVKSISSNTELAADDSDDCLFI